MAVRVDPARHHEMAGRVEQAIRTIKPIGESRDAAITDADIAARLIGRGHHRAAFDDRVEGAHVINPSPRFAQKVMRCSMTANSAYITIPITAITNRPANTSGVSK